MFHNRSRPCLLHQIKRCSAPCVGLDGRRRTTRRDVRLAELFLKGKHRRGDRAADRQDAAAAERLAFEQAAALSRPDPLAADGAAAAVRRERTARKTWTSWQRWPSAAVTVRQSGDGARRPASRRPPAFSAQRAGLRCRGGAGGLRRAALRRTIRRRRASSSISIPASWRQPRKASAERRFALALPRNEMERMWLAMAENNAMLAIRARLQDLSRDRETGWRRWRRRWTWRNRRHASSASTSAIPCGEAPVASCVVFAGRSACSSRSIAATMSPASRPATITPPCARC